MLIHFCLQIHWSFQHLFCNCCHDKMNASNFISPLETVQVLSIFTYVNTLSDFLFAENYLSEQDQRKHIPIVNSLYRYLLDNTTIKENEFLEKKTQLIRKLINGTDLYGSKDSETLDPNFVNTLFNHIIDSLVFEKFTNVYGFIVQSVRGAENDWLGSITTRLKIMLIGARFENEFGEDSSLDPLSVDSIYHDIILPLFPKPKKHTTSITSIDYIYAQAGKMFLRSGQTADTPKITTAEEIHENKYQEYIETAHAVEQLVLAKKLNETALKIFALPALINYLFKAPGNLQFESTIDIMSSPFHWKRAYETLFTKLNNAFIEIENAQANDYRYQFYLALSSIKNRTSLARELIEIHCSDNGSPLHLTDKEMEEETTNYKNNPETYKCKNSDKVLVDLNRSFYNLISNITQKYYTYEKESIREAFGDDFLESMESECVIISKGLMQFDSIDILPITRQLIRPSDDLFEFYFPENDTYSYYAFIRKDYNLKIIKESDDPILFRQKLGLNIQESFRSNYFPVLMKKGDEKFETFLDKIASERSKQFSDSLKATEYDQTRKEWWKNFGLSLIPFYSCVEGIREKNVVESAISCPLDVLFFIPVIGEVGSLVGKMSTVATKSLLAVSATSLRTVTLRTSMRAALDISGKTILKELNEFMVLFEFRTFRNLGISVLRFIDPGFELLFRIGRGGLGVLKNLIIRLGRKHLVSFASVKHMLQKTERIFGNFRKSVGKRFGKDVYVTSLGESSGYGYKYVPLKDGEMAEIRRVYPSGEEVPLVVRISGKEAGKDAGKVGEKDAGKVGEQDAGKVGEQDAGKVSEKDVEKNTQEESEKEPGKEIYKKVDLETEQIIGDDYFIEDEGFVVSDERTFELDVVNEIEDNTVDGKNILMPIIFNKLKKQVEKEALQFAASKNKLPESEIKNELNKYAFPEGEKNEMNFVQEWMNSADLKIPDWAEAYRIEESHLFYELKNKEVMENPELSVKEATERIESLYHSPLIKEELPVKRVLRDFKERKGYNQANFEDYYALRYYGGSGYLKMAENSDEARRMKNAIYRLAVRQSEDDSEECVKTLFRGEGRVTEAIEKEFYEGRKEFELKRFTSSSTSFEIADKYSEVENLAFTKVIYEIKFDKAYLRSRVEHLFVLNEKETILLPGTKFRIDKVTRGTLKKSFGTQKTMKVELTWMEVPKFTQQQRIMKEIKDLMETDTLFYAMN